MGRTKKPFIDPSKSVTFKMVPRSMQDPLTLDDDAPKFVLKEKTNVNPSEEELEDLRDEQYRYGIRYDDNYDYLQHLRSLDELENPEVLADRIRVQDEDVPGPSGVSYISSSSRRSNVSLPSSLFESDVQLRVGIPHIGMDISGPQLHWDPDIVAALDDDFDFEDPENQLEDDFVQMLQGDIAEGAEDDSDSDATLDGEEESARPALPEHFDPTAPLSFAMRKFLSSQGDRKPPQDFADDVDGSDLGSVEEKKSRYTSYSLTSSVMRRNDGLQHLDNRFDEIFAEYDDEEVGGLDEEDMQGHIDETDPRFKAAYAEYEKLKEEHFAPMYEAPDWKDIAQYEEDPQEFKYIYFDEAPKERWDAESILSQNSTCYNRPQLIRESRSSNRPSESSRVDAPGLSAAEVAEAMKRPQVIIPARQKGETTEAKRERKLVVKEMQRERREEKKATKEAFKQEKVMQERRSAGAHAGQRLEL